MDGLHNDGREANLSKRIKEVYIDLREGTSCCARVHVVFVVGIRM